jgi:hypothetical protein
MPTPPVIAFPSSRADPAAYDYRAFMRAEATEAMVSTDVVATVADQFASWVRRLKGIDLNPRLSEALQADGRAADILHHTTGGVRYVRARLAEPSARERWDTEILASDQGWVSIVVSNDSGKPAGVPQLARSLMDALSLGDGSLQFRAQATEWTVRDLDRLEALLTDPARRAPIFVVGTAADEMHAAFMSRANRWLRGVVGMAQTVILDSEATREAKDRLGPFGPKPWTIRTFLPGVDLSSSVDARRHRFMGTEALANRSDTGIISTLARVARLNASRLQDPEELIRARRIFGRLDVDAEVARDVAAVEQTVDGSVLEALATPDGDRLALRALVGAELRVELEREFRERYEARLAAAIKSARLAGLEALDRADDRLSGARSANEELELESAELREERDAARLELDRMSRTNSYLRSRLREASDYEAAETYLDAPTLPRPANCAEALARLDEFEGLIFTGRSKDVQVVDEADTLQSAASALWDAILVLDGYRRTKLSGAPTSTVREYLAATPAGAPTLPPSKHASAETAATMQQFGAERLMPVPKFVRSEQEAYMEAHFKLARIGMISPRMHYLDDVDNSGTIVIGYVGRHLRNTMTN